MKTERLKTQNPIVQAARCCHSGSGNEPINEVQVVTLPHGARVRVAVKITVIFLALRAEGWLQCATYRKQEQMRLQNSWKENMLGRAFDRKTFSAQRQEEKSLRTNELSNSI